MSLYIRLVMFSKWMSIDWNNLIRVYQHLAVDV